MIFEQLQLRPELLLGIRDMGFTDLTPVQEKTLAFSLTGQDVAVQSQTGTGKTAAFLITIFQRQLAPRPPPAQGADHRPDPRTGRADRGRGQAHRPPPERCQIGCFYGGVGYNHQEALLKRGVDIMVGTPGRLLDLESKGTLSMNDIGFLVIDEADRLFDMGFLPDIRRILRQVPAMELRQTMLFSATLSEPAMQHRPRIHEPSANGSRSPRKRSPSTPSPRSSTTWAAAKRSACCWAS